MSVLFIIDDDAAMAKCISHSCKNFPNLTIRHFTNAIDAMNHLEDDELPNLIFLDILLDGPDGFTMLHELASYPDTATIPIIIISSLDHLATRDLSIYNVKKVLNKSTMTPEEIRTHVKKYCA